MIIMFKPYHTFLKWKEIINDTWWRTISQRVESKMYYNYSRSLFISNWKGFTKGITPHSTKKYSFNFLCNLIFDFLNVSRYQPSSHINYLSLRKHQSLLIHMIFVVLKRTNENGKPAISTYSIVNQKCHSFLTCSYICG